MLKKFVFALALCAGMVVFGKDYYVDSSHAGCGDDASHGTEAAPFKTVAYALTVAKSDGDVVHVAAGSYTLTAAVTLSSGVHLIGAGADTTSLANGGKAFNMTSADALVKGFHLTGSGNTTALTMSNGTLEDCRITGSTGSATQSAMSLLVSGGTVINCSVSGGGSHNTTGLTTSYGPISVSGNATFRNCLFTGNYCAYNSCEAYNWSGGGAMYVNPGSGKTVTLENCTFVGNRGGHAGALLIAAASHAAASGTVNIRGCVFGANTTWHDSYAADAGASRTISIAGKPSSLTVNIENSVFDQFPRDAPSVVTMTDSFVGGVGFRDEFNGDYTLVAGSYGYEHGYNAQSRGEDFSCAVMAPETDRAVGSLTVTLTAKLFNAPEGTATYEWDLDGDGAYETTDKGATFEHTFTTLGWNAVGLRVTAGGQTKEYACNQFAYVAPETLVVRQKTKTSTFTPTFPYATEDTAAETLDAAVAVALDGCKIRVMEGSLAINGLKLVRSVEIFGDNREKSILKGTDKSSAIYVYDKSFLHTLTFQDGGPVINLYGDSTVSNCTVFSGNVATGGSGIDMRHGLVTHSLVYECTANQGSGLGVGLGNDAVLRNSIIRNCHCTGSHGTTFSYGAVSLSSASAVVENCTIYGNYCKGSSSYCGGVYLSAAGTVRNCIIRGNEANAGLIGSPADNDILVKSGVSTANVYNNCIPVDFGEGCQTGDPGFADVAKYDFSITSASSCYNKGANQEWMTDDATDYGGNVRLQGGTVDIGAYEADASVLVLSFETSVPVGAGSQDITFTVTGDYGQLPAGTVYKWDFDNDGTYEFETQDVTFARTMPEGASTVSMKAGDLEPVTRENAVDIKAEIVYVVTTANSNAAYPYNTWATAAPKLSVALTAAGNGSTVILTNGTHTMDRSVQLDSVVTVRGLGGRDFVTYDFKTPTDGGGIDLANPGAVVEGLTLTKGNRQSLTMSAGTIRNCKVTDCSGSTHIGTGIVASGGLIDRVWVTGCQSSSTAEGTEGMSVYLSGSAILRNSIITGNRKSSGAGNSVVYVGSGCRMENCTVYGNRSRNPAVNCVGGAVVNSVIFGNETWQDTTSAGAPNWTCGANAVFSNNVSSAACGETDITGDPEFVDPANGDFTFDAGSVCFNAGCDLDWAVEAKDYYGNPRLSGAAIDVGAFEADANAPNVSIALSATGGTGPTAIVLSAVATGFDFDASATFEWFWTSDGSGDPDATGNGVAVTFGTGVYDVYLKVTDADGAGTNFRRHKLSAITILPLDVYVTAVGNPGCEYPYDTETKAATNLADAVLAAGEGTTVHLLAGTHYVTNKVLVASGIRFVGAGRAETILKNPEGTVCSLFELRNSAASVSAMTCCEAGAPIITIAVGGGTVEDVVISGAIDSSKTAGGALYLQGGVVRRSVVRDNACGELAQCPIYIKGGAAVLEDCLVTGNSSTATGAQTAGAIHLAGGTVRNCTVVGNTSACGAGGLVVAPVVSSLEYAAPLFATPVKNTILWGNSCAENSTYDNWKTEYTYYARFSHNYSNPAVGGGSGNIGSADDPGFVNAARGDYRLQYGAPARNKGLYEDWMATAVDLKGNPRSKNPVKGKVDIGCYETGRDGFMLMVR